MALAARRTELNELFQRPELERAGVYILSGGIDPVSGKRRAYIGEAENVGERLRQHKTTEFWDSVIVFTSKDESLNKAHVKYLENRLLTEAGIGRFKLKQNLSRIPNLQEADREDMEDFLYRIRQLLPVLGSNLLIAAAEPPGRGEEGRGVEVTKKALAERFDLRQRFWTQLLKRAKDKSELHANISPSQHGWISAGSGKRGLHFNYVILKHAGMVELYIDRGKQAGDESKTIFDSLAASKDAIEKEFGGPLEWQRLEGKRACRIKKSIPLGGYRDDESKWPGIQDAMIDAMICLERAFKNWPTAWEKILVKYPGSSISHCKKVWEQKERPPKFVEPPLAAQGEILSCRMKGALGYGHRTPDGDGFVVLKGSTAVLQERGSAAKWPNSVANRNLLIADGTLIEKDDFYEFTSSVPFTSPSAAAQVIHGGPANGLTAWRTQNGTTLKELDA